METGTNLGGSSGSSFANTVSKGVIWLFIATFAEVTPVVCPGFVPSSYFLLKYVTGVYFLGSKRYLSPPARSVGDELTLNSILL